MREVGKFINTTKRTDADPTGSTIDSIYADAVLAAAPSNVIDEFGLLAMKDVGGQVDNAVFPIFDNFDLTWTNLSGTGSDLGSEVSPTTGVTGKWKKITPVMETASLFITDVLGFTVNKASFEEYAILGGQSVARRKEQEGINEGLIAAETQAGSNVYAAGGFTALGSVDSGSTLTPSDLSEARTLLSTGSNLYRPDAVLMHPNQYNSVTLDSEMSPQATTGAARKASFGENGKLTHYDGMQVIESEQIPARSTGFYVAAGHPVIVFSKKTSGAMATKNDAFKVVTHVDPLRHGQYKIFDVMQKAEVLIPESIVIINAAD